VRLLSPLIVYLSNSNTYYSLDPVQAEIKTLPGISAVITLLGNVVNGPVSEILTTVDTILVGVTTLVGNL
jgi:type IV secretory pathway VirB2 component (pilin)